MKKIFLLTSLLIFGFTVFSQNVLRFTKLDASTDFPFRNSDTLFIAEEDIIKIEEFGSGVGSNVEYVKGTGQVATAAVKEELGDSSYAAPTFTFTISFGADTVDSIKVGNVNILYVPLNLAVTQSSDSLAKRIIAAINDSTSVSGYKAYAGANDSTVVISDVDSTAAANGTLVFLFSDATLSPSSGVLRGGLALENIVTQLEQGFEVDLVGSSNQAYLQKSRVNELQPLNGGGTTIVYDRIKSYIYQVTNKRTALQTTLNGL